MNLFRLIFQKIKFEFLFPEFAGSTKQPDTGQTFHKVTVTFDEGVFTQGDQMYSVGSPVTIIKASKSYLFDQKMGRISKSSLSLSLNGVIKSKTKKEVEWIGKNKIVFKLRKYLQSLVRHHFDIGAHLFNRPC